jgi:hypothetical protein
VNQSKRSLRRDRRLLGAAAGIAVGVFLAAGISYAGIPGGPGVIRACAATGGKPPGQLRVIDTSQSCGAAETAVTWNATGPTGPRGATGPQGLLGPAGPAGPSDVIAGYSTADAELDSPCHPPANTLPRGLPGLPTPDADYACVLYSLDLPGVRPLILKGARRIGAPANGGYLIVATANVFASFNDLFCSLTAGADQDASWHQDVNYDGKDIRVALQVVHRTPLSQTAYFVCWAHKGVQGTQAPPADLANVKMTAIRVGSVTPQALRVTSG